MSTFPNLARSAADRIKSQVIEEVTAISDAELTAAGIEVFQIDLLDGSEVPSRHRGGLHGWGFRRAWYYWVAKGPGIPPAIAEELHRTHGRAVRVDGHCGCPSPLEWLHGFAVGLYHVDTPEALKALADTLNKVRATVTKSLQPAEQTAAPVAEGQVVDGEKVIDIMQAL